MNEWDTREDEHEKINIPNLQAAMFYFCYIDLLITFLTIFWRFHKIPLKLSEGHKNVSEQFPKLSEDYWRKPKIVEDLRKDPKMFWSYTKN